MSPAVLKLLIEGAYICPVRYRDAFAVLQEEGEQEAVDGWLSHLNMRLARLGEEGAFFMAPAYIGAKEVTQVKGELMRFRDEYGPAVLFLDFIRQTDSTRHYLSPGEYVALYELDAAVSQSTMLEAGLKALIGSISGASVRLTNHENLKRLLEHLAKDGYVVLVNKETGTYQVTGKIDQLYAVLQFLDEHQVIPDAEVDDSAAEEDQGDLVDDAKASGGEGAGEGGHA